MCPRVDIWHPLQCTYVGCGGMAPPSGTVCCMRGLGPCGGWVVNADEGVRVLQNSSTCHVRGTSPRGDRAGAGLA
eukprot:12904722-Prorocentrum_lima.AAC.1